jgi:hypothetical protein
VFCSEIANYTKCYVVASTEKQWTLPVSSLPLGQVDIYAGFTLTYGPHGKVIDALRFPANWTGD